MKLLVAETLARANFIARSQHLDPAKWLTVGMQSANNSLSVSAGKFDEIRIYENPKTYRSLNNQGRDERMSIINGLRGRLKDGCSDGISFLVDTGDNLPLGAQWA